MFTDPGYQFRLNQGLDAITSNAAARGVLRTGGNLQDLMDYGQNAASQEYQNVWNRAYMPWQQQYQGNLAAWQTQYGGDLQKYLQREQNIYGLLNAPPPIGGGY
jgi:hypothetical protein